MRDLVSIVIIISINSCIHEQVQINSVTQEQVLLKNSSHCTCTNNK